VRTGQYNEWDQGIVREVTQNYLWDKIDIAGVKTAIDLGAHIAAWSVYLRHLNPECRIITVEPDGENATIGNLNLYGDRKTFRYHAACQYAPGNYFLARHDENSGGHVVVCETEADAMRDNPHREVIPVNRVVTLEEVMAIHAFEGVDLLKIDVEGGEFDILGKMPMETLKKIGCIVGEWHGDQAHFNTAVGARLRTAGFTVDYVPHPNPNVDGLGMFLAKRD
jgi:FkbM family methyltransferase